MTSIVQPHPTCSNKIVQPGLGLIQSLLLSLPFFLSSMLLQAFPTLELAPPLRSASYLAIWAVLNIVFFMMLRSGKTDRYRSVIFIAMAVTFSFTFILELVETRGSMQLYEETAISGNVPFCHLAIATVLIPAALQKTVIFSGSILGDLGVASMLALWMGVSLALGRGWCSWSCFYGGFDELFSRVSKRPLIKKIDERWRYLPYAVLLFVALTSAALYTPVFCDWLCPYKAVTEYKAVTDLVTLLQFIVFVSLFLALVIILPLLTKKRSQCAFYCPLGAIQNLTNKINVYEVCIDTEKCVRCGLCVKNCPMMALDESSLESGKPLLNCSKCGKCIDICSQNAIHYHIKGTPAASHPLLARILFLYPAFLLMSTFTVNFVGETGYRILKLVITGSLI